MEIQELWRVISQRWRIVAIATLLAMVVALAWSLAGPVSYKAQGRVVISTSGSLGTAGDAFSGEQVSVQRAPTYAQLLSGPEVASRASAKLHGEISAQDIQDAIHAQITARLPMVIVTATSRSANDAVQIVAAAEQGLQEYVKEIERPGRDGSLTSVVLSGDAPVVIRESHPVRNTALAGLLGLIVGVMLAVHRDRTDPMVKSAGQIATHGFVYRGTVAADSSPEKLDEALRRIAVGILASGDSDAARMLLVGVDRDCDTDFVARALARALALCGRPTTFVDGIGAGGPRRRAGLSDVFVGSVDWRAYAIPTDTENLAELGIGTMDTRLDVLLIEGNNVKKRLPVSDPREHIVLAGPSIVHSSVAVALTAVVDSAVIVVRQGSSKVSDVAEARMALDAMGVKALGMLLVTGESRVDDPDQATTVELAGEDAAVSVRYLPVDGDEALTVRIRQSPGRNGSSSSATRARNCPVAP